MHPIDVVRRDTLKPTDNHYADTLMWPIAPRINRGGWAWTTRNGHSYGATLSLVTDDILCLAQIINRSRLAAPLTLQGDPGALAMGCDVANLSKVIGEFTLRIVVARPEESTRGILERFELSGSPSRSARGR
jgi:hypothetical protein